MRVGWYSPNTPRSTSAISPTVASAFTAPTIGKIRFAVPRAASSRARRARSVSAWRPAGAGRPHPRDLIALELRVDRRDLDRRLVGDREVVDADHDALLLLDRALVLVRAPLDLLLDEAALDRGDHAALRLDLVDVALRAGLDLRRSAPRPPSCRRADR